MRFAHSEFSYLNELQANVSNLMGDSLVLNEITAIRAAANSYDLPRGGLPDPPILVNLFNAINLSGPFVPFRSACINDFSRSWVLYYPIVDFPAPAKSFQSAVLNALTAEHNCKDFDKDINAKLTITLRPSVSGSLFPGGGRLLFHIFGRKELLLV